MTDPTTDVGTALERLAQPAPHLRWRLARADEPLRDDELACAALAADPDVLAAAVAATATGRGSDDPQVLASLWWQAYAYRVAGTALGVLAPVRGGTRPAGQGHGGGHRPQPALLGRLPGRGRGARRGPGRQTAPPRMNWRRSSSGCSPVTSTRSPPPSAPATCSAAR